MYNAAECNRANESNKTALHAFILLANSDNTGSTGL